jgi:hypothetical protein
MESQSISTRYLIDNAGTYCINKFLWGKSMRTACCLLLAVVMSGAAVGQENAFKGKPFGLAPFTPTVLDWIVLKNKHYEYKYDLFRDKVRVKVVRENKENQIGVQAKYFKDMPYVELQQIIEDIKNDIRNDSFEIFFEMEMRGQTLPEGAKEWQESILQSMEKIKAGGGKVNPITMWGLIEKNGWVRIRTYTHCLDTSSYDEKFSY